jgi:HlyD family secretion protein
VNATLARMMRKSWGWIVLVIVLAALLYRVKFMPVDVATQPVETGEIVAEVMGTGTLEARFQTTVSSKIQGRLAEVPVDQNDRVYAGQLIARLDDADLAREVGIARATLDAAQATVKRVRADESRARAVKDQAERDYHRYSALSESKSISQENVEKTREKLAVADAEADRASAATTESVRQVTTAEERLLYAEARLADTRIVSPFDGLVVRRDRETGDIAVPGASIFQIISLKEMWVSAWVDESAMSGLSPGQSAAIVFRSEPKKRYEGKVARLGREVDRETREFKVDVRIYTLPDNWAVGQRAEVYIETARKSGVTTAPLRAVVWNRGKAGVFVVDDGHARLHEVALGLRGIDKVEVIKGLSKNDLCVVDPVAARIKEGQRVRNR